MNHPSLRLMMIVTSMFAAGCSEDPGVSSESEARLAYLGLDTAVGRAIDLGFAGFNAASSANIPEQTGTGTASGTMAINGQVDQGASANKGMRLTVALTDYSDGPFGDPATQIDYDTTATALPALQVMLKSIPTGTLEGTLIGAFTMSRDLTGTVSLNLTFEGPIEPDPADATKVRRVANMTHITGTATSPNGTYTVDLMR